MDAAAWRGTGKMFIRGFPVMAGVETPVPLRHLQWPWRAGDTMPAGESLKLPPDPLTDATSNWWLLF